MRYFPSDDDSIYSTKVNFVDENNVLVGYDFSGQCCEQYGWYISNKPTINKDGSLFDDNVSNEAINESLKDWTFDKEFFDQLSYSESGSFDQDDRVVFRLVNGDNELFLHLYNVHNGYYSHGFEFKNGEETIQTGHI